MEIISRSNAKLLGLKTYFTGKPCLRGHISERRVNTCSCIECSIIAIRKWQQENPDKLAKYTKKFRTANPENIIERNKKYRDNKTE